MHDIAEADDVLTKVVAVKDITHSLLYRMSELGVEVDEIILVPSELASARAQEGLGMSVVPVDDGHPLRVPAEKQAYNLFKWVEPAYPEAARAQGISGAVLLRVQIGRDGQVTQVDVVDGPPVLTEAARAAVRQWVYLPSERSVETTVLVEFHS
jgi:TonB family protein